MRSKINCNPIDLLGLKQIDPKIVAIYKKSPN